MRGAAGGIYQNKGVPQDICPPPYVHEYALLLNEKKKSKKKITTHQYNNLQQDKCLPMLFPPQVTVIGQLLNVNKLDRDSE